MKKILVALVAALAAAITVSAPAAAADTSPGVVTNWEFNHVQPGMTRAHVTRMFGVNGYGWLQGNSSTLVVVRYPAAGGGHVYVRFVIDYHTQTITVVDKYRP